MGYANLKHSGESLNSRKSKIICTPRRRCKRMACDTCKEIRRNYFVTSGLQFAITNNMNTHLVLSWGKKRKGCNWLYLLSNISRLSTRVAGVKIRPYIRVISIGPEGCPHVHLLTTFEAASRITALARKLWGRKIKSFSKELNRIDPDAANVLGYFFDMNFIPSFFDETRIKGIRLISATRPMRCGFPSKRSDQQASNQQIAPLELPANRVKTERVRGFVELFNSDSISL